MKDIFEKLIYSLNNIEVKGKTNLDILLGCIQTLEQLRDLITTETKEVPVVEDGDNN